MTYQEQTATTANNLANVDTAGFKSDLLLFTSAPSIHTWRVDDPATIDRRGQTSPEYIGLTNAGTADTEIWRDFTPGQLVQTNRPLDVAITGDGFFRMRGADGVEVYTRDGQFKLTPDGFLVDNQGRRVQGLNGAINVGASNDVNINASGEVWVDGAQVERINLAFFSDPQQQLTKVGDNAWSANTAPDSVGVTDVRAGFVERSNVDVFRCLGEMIVQLRNYEAAQKVVQAEDATLDLTANQIGKMPQ